MAVMQAEHSCRPLLRSNADLQVAAMGFAVDVSRQPGHQVLHVTGDVDVYTAPRLGDLLQTAAADGVATVVVDLSMCRYFDSEGVKTLIRAHLSMGESSVLVIRGVRGAVDRVFRIAGLDGYLNVERDPTD